MPTKTRNSCPECKRLRRLAAKTFKAIVNNLPSKVLAAREEGRKLLQTIRQHEGESGHQVGGHQVG